MLYLKDSFFLFLYFLRKVQLIVNRQYREVISLRINVQCPRLPHSALFVNCALKRFENNPFMLRKRSTEIWKVERIWGSWRLKASLLSYFLFLISTVLFQSNFQLLFPRRASDGWVWGIGLVVASHKVHPSWPQSTWMFLKEPFSFHVPVNWSGWVRRGNWENFLLVSLTEGWKLLSWCYTTGPWGPRLFHLPPFSRYPHEHSPAAGPEPGE